MDTGLVYEIARYSVGSDTEVLVECAQVISRDGALWRRMGDGVETRCGDTDVGAVIAADALLNEVRANQVTRISGEPTVLQELPFLLRVPGHRDDFDESLWSEAMRDELVDEEWPPGVYRVLYVNGQRWSAWPTAGGERMLPVDWPLVRLAPCWGRLSVCEWGSMVSGSDETVIGLATPRAVAAATLPDPGVDPEEQEVLLRRRGENAADDAQMFVEWLLDGGLMGYWGNSGEVEDVYQAMLAELFVEASMNNCNGVGVPGSRLAAGTGTERGSDSEEWQLELDLAPEVIDAVLDLLAERSPRLSDIVTAARDPESPTGVARRAALEEWAENFEPQAWQRQ